MRSRYEFRHPVRFAGDADGGGFEPPVPFGTHAFQACTINHSVTHPGSIRYLWRRSLTVAPAFVIRRSESAATALQLQTAKQFVQRQLNADIKFAEIGVLRADRIEPHLVNDGLDLEGIARE